MDILGSNLANMYVMHLAGRNVCKLQVESNKLVAEGSFKLLDVLHHLTSGFKSFTTELSYSGLDALRQACGGAGYTVASGICEVWMDVSPGPTFEGINVVMH